MIIVMKKSATKAQIDHVIEKVKEQNLKPVPSRGIERTVVAVIGEEAKLRAHPMDALPGVEKVMPVQKPYKMVSREFHGKNSVINLGKGVKLGGKKVIMMAGPCTIENEQRLLRIARHVKKAGAEVLRGGAFKPRTSPYDFQGLGEEGLKYLQEARQKTGLLVVSELMDIRDIPLFNKYVDIVQIGARNMQNFNLLKEMGRVKKPILLKRGMANTIKEFLMAAEYVYAHGNHDVILCERGLRTFDDSMRFTLDIGAIPVLKSLSHLPVVIDPSHPAGKRAYVPALAKAGLAAGADGLIVEVHDEPEEALCDGAQALLPKAFISLMAELRGIAKVIGRTI